MGGNIPDLNDTYVEPLFWYSPDKGYMCPDFVEGFNDVIETGDVITPRVQILFDQLLADSYEVGLKKKKCEVLGEEEGGSVVGEVEDDEGFVSWLDLDENGRKMISV